MNYITTCPACETQFLLNTDQLKAQRGKVQCGHCQQLFNAKNRLTEVAENTNIDAALSTDISIRDADDSTVENGASNNSSVDHIQAFNDTSDNYTSDTSDFSTNRITAFHTDENLRADDRETFNDQTEGSNSASAPTIIQDLTTEPQFTKEPFNLKKLWISLLGLLLLILALLQTLYFFRTQIAAQYPQFKPYLLQACRALNCEIKLAQNLNLLTIDDSDMQESDDYEDVISFSSVLINNANYVQAYPNIELTLTDTQDQPVLRKLVTPKEYLTKNIQVEAGMDARQELRLNLVIDASELTVAGYRVLLVY